MEALQWRAGGHDWRVAWHVAWLCETREKCETPYRWNTAWLRTGCPMDCDDQHFFLEGSINPPTNRQPTKGFNTVQTVHVYLWQKYEHDQQHVAVDSLQPSKPKTGEVRRQRVWMYSMASKCHQNSLLWEFLWTARPNVTTIPNYRNNFWYWSWEWLQTINYHSKLLITITYDHSFVYYHIWCVYIYISCTFMYIHVHIYMLQSFIPHFFVHLLPWHPVRFHRFAFRNTVTHRTLW